MPELEPNGTPAASVTAGQQPTNGTPATQTADPNAQQTPAANANANEQPNANDKNLLDPTILNPAAKAAADEAARYRRELREAQKRIEAFEAEKKAAEDAKLSETERLKKQYAEAQAEAAQAKLQARERILRAEIKAAATAAGIKPDLAIRLIDSKDVVDDPETGDPDLKVIAALLTKAITEYGLTPPAATQPGVSQQSGTPPSTLPTTPNPGATNPARQNGPLTITLNQAYSKEFQTQFQQQYGMSVTDAVLKGKAQLV